MTTTTTTAARYRKTKAGEWVAFGPSSIIHLGTVTVTKVNGQYTAAEVVRLGKEFDVDGVAHRYGYLAPAAPCPGCGEEHRHGTRTCWECGGAL